MIHRLLHSLRTKMVLWLFVFVVPILAILYTNILTANRAFETQTRRSIDQIMLPFAADMNAALSSARRYVANLDIDLSLLTYDEADALAALEWYAQTADRLSQDLTLYPDIGAIFLYDGAQIRLIQNYNGSYTENRLVALALADALGQREDFSALFAQGYLSVHAEERDYLYTGIETAGGVIGCWFSMDDLLAGVRDAQLLGLTDAALHPRQEASGAAGQLVTHTALEAADYDVVAVWEEGVVLSPVADMHRNFYVAVFVTVLLFALYLLFLHASLIRPLNRLIDAIRGVRRGSLSPIAVREDEDVEIKGVYHAVNEMTDQIKALKIRMYEEQIVKQKTQMQLYQLQIRPHFFQNAINSIVSFARMKQTDRVERMGMHLAAHCRYVLYNSWFVRAEEELDYTRNYVEMYNMQHNAAYRYMQDAPEDVLDCEVPILAIQIFVENAIKYGYHPDMPLTIRVALRTGVEQGAPQLFIQIDDDGVGFSQKLLDALNGSDIPDTEGRSRGIGIANVRQRLHLLYGERASLRISNNEAGGAHIAMRLPIDDAREDRP